MLRKLPDQKIIHLYITKKLSTRQIASLYHCSKSTISSHLKNNGVKLRNHSESKKLRPTPDKYQVPLQKLRSLYLEQKLSAYQIARMYNCGPTTIALRLKRYNIPRRTPGAAIALTSKTRGPKIANSNTKYPKVGFNGSPEQKAYLIGFRLGDLYVSKKPFGTTVVVQSWSTKPDQNKLIQELFSGYGHILVNKKIHFNKEHVGVTIFLNSSFDFLLEKGDLIPKWIQQSKSTFLAFLAGYLDAEGHFGVDRGFGRLSVSSYQKNILNQVQQKLEKMGIKCPVPYKSVNAGYKDKRGIVTKQDLWTLRVNRQGSIIRLFRLLTPHLKHKKRRDNAQSCYEAARRNLLRFDKSNPLNYNQPNV